MERPKIEGRVLSYSEILRVIGRYLDRHGIGETRVIETGDSFILQGVLQTGPRTGERDTYQLSAEDIVDLRNDATAQRGKQIF
ncbi:MAG: hypothetical protein HY741_03350 [Chloroflexi bacterium]|nr:hypothetical protein [Chloroflexota bacterium]